MNTSVHLLPAGELVRPYGPAIAVCGEALVTAVDGAEGDPVFCTDCVTEALRWNAVASELPAVGR